MKTAYRRLAYTSGVILLGVYGYYTLWGSRGIPALLQQSKQIRQFEEDIANLNREAQSKRDRIVKLNESPSTQDLEIRKGTRKIQEGDVEFMLPPAPKPAEPQPAVGQ